MELLEHAAVGFLTNLGFFAPAAVIMWWVIKTQRLDAEKREAQLHATLEKSNKRNEALEDRIIELARSMERTMAEFAAVIRNGRR